MAPLPPTDRELPAETARVMKAAFPKGHPYMTLRHELGVIYANDDFAALFSLRGAPAEAPGRLALVTVLQFAEGLSDRQAASAVAGRLDWKFLMGLELTDPGFDYSLLSEFRQRLVTGSAEMQLLDKLLERFKERGLLKARRTQRTDSTHVLEAVRALNRLELVGETLRATLNELASIIPDWVQAHVPSTWYERYAARFEAYSLPQTEAKRAVLALTIGQDGCQLLNWLSADPDCAALRQAPAVEALRQIWLQNYSWVDGQLHWRGAGNLPPAEQMIRSPYDLASRYSTKRALAWGGYKAFLSETCAVDEPHFITHVATSVASTPDTRLTEPIQQALRDKRLPPDSHLVDSGFIDAELLVHSRQDQQIELLGPLQRDSSWQAQAGAGFDLSHFQLDWDAAHATCPQGHRSRYWSLSHNLYQQTVIHVKFAEADCAACPCRAQCTHSVQGPRTLKLHTREEHEALQAGRARMADPEFKRRIARRAGVESLISQAVRAFELRHTRYRGLAKTHLQHVAIAAAINLKRLADWLSPPLTPRARNSSFAALAPAA
jgi:transposase